MYICNQHGSLVFWDIQGWNNQNGVYTACSLGTTRMVCIPRAHWFRGVKYCTKHTVWIVYPNESKTVSSGKASLVKDIMTLTPVHPHQNYTYRCVQVLKKRFSNLTWFNAKTGGRKIKESLCRYLSYHIYIYIILYIIILLHFYWYYCQHWVGWISVSNWDIWDHLTGRIFHLENCRGDTWRPGLQSQEPKHLRDTLSHIWDYSIYSTGKIHGSTVWLAFPHIPTLFQITSSTLSVDIVGDVVSIDLHSKCQSCRSKFHIWNREVQLLSRFVGIP